MPIRFTVPEKYIGVLPRISSESSTFCRVEFMQQKCVSTPIFIGASATTADSSNAAVKKIFFFYSTPQLELFAR
jgi:hypothetical protein